MDEEGTDNARTDRRSSVKINIVKNESGVIDKSTEDRTNVGEMEKTHIARKYYTKHMRLYPELYRSDVSIHPSYSGLMNLPYYVVCRRRALKKKKQIARQLNREIMHIAMMQSYALAVYPARVAKSLVQIVCQVRNGWIRRITDEEVKSLALEIAGTNVSTTFIYAPKNPKTVLAITLPFLIMIIKNMKKYFTFEITVLDDHNMHRRFRISNFQSTTKVRAFSTSMPIGLCDGWNQIQFNLADFTRRAYGSNYVETTRMQIHANCRIRRIYFADRLYSDDQLPEDYKLLIPKRESTIEGKKPGKRSQAKISASAVPAAEPPAFQGDLEKLDEEGPRQTTPVASREPSRMVVAPDHASKVQIQITAQSEDEESMGREYDEEFPGEGGTTDTEHEDEADEMIPGDQQGPQEAALITTVEEEEEEGEGEAATETANVEVEAEATNVEETAAESANVENEPEAANIEAEPEATDVEPGPEIENVEASEDEGEASESQI